MPIILLAPRSIASTRPRISFSVLVPVRASPVTSVQVKILFRTTLPNVKERKKADVARHLEHLECSH